MRPVQDLHVDAMTPLVSPRELKTVIPAGEASHDTVAEGREAITRIARRDDDRLLLVVGPCSIHDPKAALEYAALLNDARKRYADRLCIVMRTYFEKPRTTIGWRGLINDPHLDGSFDMVAGLKTAREILVEITAMGLPVAAEMLDPVTPQYFADLVSWAAIGARTTESQPHRALASGLSMPVGFKNSTDGSLQIAIDAMVSARHPHSFLGVDPNGVCCVVKTTGNPDVQLILRGGRSGSNYDAGSVAAAVRQTEAAGLDAAALVVDCSHANSGYDSTRQEAVLADVVGQRVAGERALMGAMLESNLHAGKQSIPEDLSRLRYGISVTDACIDWETTERVLRHAYEQLGGEGRVFSTAGGKAALAAA